MRLKRENLKCKTNLDRRSFKLYEMRKAEAFSNPIQTSSIELFAKKKLIAASC